MSTEQVTYIITLRDRVTKSLKTVNKSLTRTDRAFLKLGSSMARFASAAALGMVLKNSIQKMIVFEKVASNLSAITGATGDELEFLKRKALEMGGATTKSSKEVLEGFKLIASAKPELLTNSDALAKTTKEAIALAEASGLTLPDAAKSLTSALNQFNLDADQSSRVINILAAGSKFAAAEIPELSASLEEFGGVAESLNISIEESAAAVETLSAKNLKGARAGIQLRNVLLKLGSSTDRKINPKIVGLSKALENLGGIQDNTTALTKMFGIQNVLAAQTLIKSRKRFDKLTVSMTGTNVAYEQARTNTDNLTGDFDRLGSSWEKLILGLNQGEGAITGMFRRITQFATQFLDKLDLINKTQAQINQEVSGGMMQKLIGRIGGVETRNELFEALVKETSNVKGQLIKYGEEIDKLGGREAIEGAFKGKRHVGVMLGLISREKEIERVALRDLLKGSNEYLDQLNKILNSETELSKLLSKIKPPKAEKDPNAPSAATDIFKPSKAVKKQITTITGAAPKTFNINIDKLVEQFNVNTENLTEGAADVKKQITLALAEALADVQPITD